MKIKTRINGKDHVLELNGSETLLSVIRNRLSLTGTKQGCGKGECGACTVIIDGKTACSCLVLASQVNEKDVITIEGLQNDGELHPLQKSFIEEGAVQCGFCTPGMILSAYALLVRNPSPTDEQIKTSLAGNLCRCTGYDKIFKAVRKAAEVMKNA